MFTTDDSMKIWPLRPLTLRKRAAISLAPDHWSLWNRSPAFALHPCFQILQIVQITTQAISSLGRPNASDWFNHCHPPSSTIIHQHIIAAQGVDGCQGWQGQSRGRLDAHCVAASFENSEAGHGGAQCCRVLCRCGFFHYPGLPR